MINRQLNEVSNWLDVEFENEEVLDYGDGINRLIIERGIEEHYIKNIYRENLRLTIDFDEFESISIWENTTIPNQIIEDHEGDIKENLIGAIQNIDDMQIIRKLTKKLEKLINE